MMKKIILLIGIALALYSCASYRSLDLTKLTTGMTKAQVRSLVGNPNRVLAVNDTKDGYQEILEYRTGRDEIYALEFWNDYLTGYEYLYDDINYVPPVAPPYWYPDYYGRPIVVYPPNYYPNQPNRPNRPNPPSPPSRPEPNRPNRPTPPSRPEQPNRQGLTRPTPGVGPGSNSSGSGNATIRPTTRPTPR